MLYFRRCIAVRSHLCRVRRVILHPRHTKVAQLEIAKARDHDIVRLDVPVNDIPLLTQDQRPADVFSETDHLLLREHFLLHRLWKRRQKLHPDKNAAADPIFTRHDCKVVAAHDVRLSLQLPHHLIFLHVALQLIRVCRHHALRIIAIVIVCLDLLIIRRA